MKCLQPDSSAAAETSILQPKILQIKLWILSKDSIKKSLANMNLSWHASDVVL